MFVFLSLVLRQTLSHPCDLALHKDHLDISYVRFGGGDVGPDEGFGDVWEIHASVVHDRGLEMSS